MAKGAPDLQPHGRRVPGRQLADGADDLISAQRWTSRTRTSHASEQLTGIVRSTLPVEVRDGGVVQRVAVEAHEVAAGAGGIQ